MSAVFVITSDEWHALRSVDHLARDLYQALRRDMNFKTGVVGGPEKGISWQSLREDTEVPGRPGFKAVKPSEQQLRRRMKQLEQFGLIRSIGDKLRLRFRLLLARTDNNALKKADTGAIAPKPARKPARQKDLPGYSQTDSSPKADTHQNPGKTYTLPNPSHACGAGGVNIQPPTPAAREGDLDPQQQHAQAQTSSEERHEPARAAGEKRDPDEGGEPAIAWRPELDWPVGLIPAHRAEVARKLACLPGEDKQRVLDELQGMSEVTTIRHWWKTLSFMIGKAKVPGWEPEHADRVRQRRERLRAAMAAAAEQAKRDDALPRTVAPSGWATGLIARIRGGALHDG